MNNRGFQGIWIEKNIWISKNLTLLEKVLYVEIQSLQGENEQGCYATNDYFANFFGLKVRQIQNLLKSLKEKGLIYQAGTKGKFRILKINDFNEFEKNNTQHLEIEALVLFLLIQLKDYKKVLTILNTHNITHKNFSGRGLELYRLIMGKLNNNKNLDFVKLSDNIIWNVNNYFKFCKIPSNDNLEIYINLIKKGK